MHGKLLAAMAVFCAVISGGSVSAGGVEDASDDVGDFVLERTDEKPVEAMKGLQSKEGTTKNETGEPVEAIKRLALKEAATTNETTAATADEAAKNATGDKAIIPTGDEGYVASDQALIETPDNAADQARVRTADHPANHHHHHQENEAQNAGCGPDAGNLLPTVVACLGLLFLR